MKASAITLIWTFAVACVVGCTSISETSDIQPGQVVVPGMKVSQQKPQLRQWNETQLGILRAFALQESPKLWQTVQALRAERETRTAALAKLRAELVDFGRDPEADPDFAALNAANEGLLESLNAVYTKIEGAYFAYKKYQATPGNKEYGDMMRRVLDDGMNEATAAEGRYLRMSREK